MTTGQAAIFIGPSLPPQLAWPDGIERLPPAALGDIYRLASRPQPPRLIGIVDGYFERRPPVRHAEILWALSRGIRVLGAASIGALRAAELDEHGMEGLGAIYQGYRSGLLQGEPLEADDEVAVLHGPAALGHPPVTVALVDLRASLAAAVAANVVTEAERHLAVEAARRLHFKERSYPRALQGLTDGRRASLLAWLDEHADSLKQQDALLLIRRVAELAKAPSAPPTVPPFRVTDAWLDFIEWVEGGGSAEWSDADLVTALALDPALRERVLRQALLSLLARREAARRGLAGDAVETLLDRYSPMLARGLGAALDALGERARVEESIRRRRAARQRLEDGDTFAVTAHELLAWHCRRIGTAPPLDLEAYARSLGLARGEQLIRALAEEFVAHHPAGRSEP